MNFNKNSNVFDSEWSSESFNLPNRELIQYLEKDNEFRFYFNNIKERENIYVPFIELEYQIQIQILVKIFFLNSLEKRKKEEKYEEIQLELKKYKNLCVELQEKSEFNKNKQKIESISSTEELKSKLNECMKKIKNFETEVGSLKNKNFTLKKENFELKNEISQSEGMKDSFLDSLNRTMNDIKDLERQKEELIQNNQMLSLNLADLKDKFSYICNTRRESDQKSENFCISEVAKNDFQSNMSNEGISLDRIYSTNNSNILSNRLEGHDLQSKTSDVKPAHYFYQKNMKNPSQKNTSKINISLTSKIREVKLNDPNKITSLLKEIQYESEPSAISNRSYASRSSVLVKKMQQYTQDLASNNSEYDTLKHFRLKTESVYTEEENESDNNASLVEFYEFSHDNRDQINISDLPDDPK